MDNMHAIFRIYNGELAISWIASNLDVIDPVYHNDYLKQQLTWIEGLGHGFPHIEVRRSSC